MLRQLIDRDGYTFRILGTLIIAQVLVVLSIKFWPLTSMDSPIDIVYINPEAIEMEEVVNTHQARPTPPPVAPLPPVIKPVDMIIPDDPLTDLDPLQINETLSEPPIISVGSSSLTIDNPSPPKPIRIVTPEYPRPAQRKRVRAEVIISVVVDKSGNVQSPQILERYLLSESGNVRTLVEELGYGLEDAAVSAALKSLFRPAKKGGMAVDGRHRLSFKFGI
ncbi:MAG: hypothetical protein OXE59_00595 [Bacteroidetes bacterium]|nr:hypothetical protein [Bacteroidota bacterium]MCY4232234.1 hypothetical protein [Bacteroidota bacterium]